MPRAGEEIRKKATGPTFPIEEGKRKLRLTF